MLIWADEYRRLYGEPAPEFTGYEAVEFNRKLREAVERAAPDSEVTPTLFAQCARQIEGKQ